jgi:K(+)-stimulated pyrophosphate-energized sodium pump
MELTFTLLCSVLALGFALRLAQWVLKHDDGTPEMRTISNAIREGAEAFLLRQYKTIALLTLPVACVIFALYASPVKVSITY